MPNAPVCPSRLGLCPCRWPRLVAIAALAGMVALLAGCATAPLQPPAMRHESVSDSRDAAPVVLSAVSLRGELRDRGIPPEAVGPHAMNDDYYVVPDHRWLTERFLPYFGHVRQSLGLRHAGEGFDCDNFTALLKQQLALANRRTPLVANGDVACASMKVQQVEGFGAVPSLGEDLHSVNLLRTSDGWFVVEPQDGHISTLAAYPNREKIIDLYF